MTNWLTDSRTLAPLPLVRLARGGCPLGALGRGGGPGAADRGIGAVCRVLLSIGKGRLTNGFTQGIFMYKV